MEKLFIVVGVADNRSLPEFGDTVFGSDLDSGRFEFLTQVELDDGAYIDADVFEKL